MKKMNIPIPEVYEIVNIGARTGIIYEKLKEQSILEKLVQGENTKDLIKQIADFHKTILKRHTSEGISYKKFLELCIGEKTKLNMDMYDEIASLPEGNSLCHGDYHPGNIWIDKSGEMLLIDFMNVCHGPWQYDVARTYVLISEGDLPNIIFLKMPKLIESKNSRIQD